MIDMALLDVQVGVLANQAMNYLVSGKPPRRMGNAHPNIVPYRDFATADGVVIVAVGNDRQFRAFAAASRQRRSRRRSRLRHQRGPRGQPREPGGDPASAGRRASPAPTSRAKLEAAGVPYSPVNRLDQVFAEPQVVHRAMRLDLPLVQVAARCRRCARRS